MFKKAGWVVVALAMLSFSGTACNGSSGGVSSEGAGSSGPAPEAIKDVQGSWKTDCSVQTGFEGEVQQRLQFSGKKLIHSVTVHDSKAGCGRRMFTLSFTYTVNSASATGTNRSMNVTSNKLELTPHNGFAADFMGSRLCGYDSWQDDSAKDVSNRNCNGNYYSVGKSGLYKIDVRPGNTIEFEGVSFYRD